MFKLGPWVMKEASPQYCRLFERNRKCGVLVNVAILRSKLRWLLSKSACVKQVISWLAQEAQAGGGQALMTQNLRVRQEAIYRAQEEEERPEKNELHEEEGSQGPRERASRPDLCALPGPCYDLRDVLEPGL